MRITFCCATLAFVLACGQARPLAETDKASLRSASDSFAALVRAGNDSGVAELYTENGVMMPPNEGIVEGRAAIRAYFEKLPPEMEIELTPVDLDGRGDLAYVRGTYVVTIGGAVADRGKFLEIRRREGGREWLMSVDIYNSDQPPMAPPPPPAQSRPNRTPRE